MWVLGIEPVEDSSQFTLLPCLCNGGCGAPICFPVCSNRYAILSIQTTSKKIPPSVQLLGSICSRKQMVVFPSQGAHLPWETVPCWLVGDKAGAHSQSFLPPFEHHGQLAALGNYGLGLQRCFFVSSRLVSAFILFFFFLFWSDFQRSVSCLPPDYHKSAALFYWF